MQSESDHWRETYRADLDGATDSARAAIRAVLQLTVPPEVTSAKLEFFMDDYGGSPRAWIYFNGKNRRVSHTDLSIFPGRSMELDLGLAGYCQVDEDLWENMEVQDQAAQLLVAWFRDQWTQAGGAGFPIRVDLSVHDGIGKLKPKKLTDAV